MSKRPLIPTRPVDEFGGFSAADLENMAEEAPMDSTFVPGWSPMRRQRDIELGELAEGRRRADEVSSLPVNVRIVSRSSPSGAFTSRKLMQASANGYRPIVESDLGELWFTEMPPGATVMPDGSIVNAAGDGQYMVCEARRAALNKYRKEVKMLEQAAQAGTKIEGGIGEVGGTFQHQALDAPLLFDK